MAKSTVHGRWGLRHLNFVFICRMATRLRMKLRTELFFTVIKLFWGVHVQVLAEIFAQRWAVSLSQRLVTEAIGMQRQPWSNWTFLTKRNRLTTLEWSPTTMAVQFRFHVMVGLKLAAQRARAKQNRAMGSPWRRGWRRWWSGVRSWRCTWRKRCSRSLETRTISRTWRMSPLTKKVRWERGWERQRSRTRSRKRPWSRKRCWRKRKQRGQQWCATTHLGHCESGRI